MVPEWARDKSAGAPGHGRSVFAGLTRGPAVSDIPGAVASGPQPGAGNAFSRPVSGDVQSGHWTVRQSPDVAGVPRPDPQLEKLEKLGLKIRETIGPGPRMAGRQISRYQRRVCRLRRGDRV
jgi:hypothetical protein